LAIASVQSSHCLQSKASAFLACSAQSVNAPANRENRHYDRMYERMHLRHRIITFALWIGGSGSHPRVLNKSIKLTGLTPSRGETGNVTNETRAACSGRT
jgi:hypothetical protein